MILQKKQKNNQNSEKKMTQTYKVTVKNRDTGHKIPMKKKIPSVSKIKNILFHFLWSSYTTTNTFKTTFIFTFISFYKRSSFITYTKNVSFHCNYRKIPMKKKYEKWKTHTQEQNFNEIKKYKYIKNKKHCFPYFMKLIYRYNHF